MEKLTPLIKPNTQTHITVELNAKGVLSGIVVRLDNLLNKQLYTTNSVSVHASKSSIWVTPRNSVDKYKKVWIIVVRTLNGAYVGKIVFRTEMRDPFAYMLLHPHGTYAKKLVRLVTYRALCAELENWDSS